MCRQRSVSCAACTERRLSYRRAAPAQSVARVADINIVLATFRTTGTLPVGTRLPVRKRDEPSFQPGEILAIKAKPDGSHRA